MTFLYQGSTVKMRRANGDLIEILLASEFGILVTSENFCKRCQISGHNKDQFTVVLCASAGLKHALCIMLPPNIIIHASKGGSMNRELMMVWIQACYVVGSAC